MEIKFKKKYKLIGKELLIKLKMNPQESKGLALNISNIMVCNNFETFIILMDEAKYSVKEIFFNGKKHDKRKTNFVDFEDLFDNKISVKYLFTKNRLDILIGN